MTAEAQRAPQVREQTVTSAAPRIDLGATSMERAAAAAVDRSEWDAAFARWEAADKAYANPPIGLSRDQDDALASAEWEAWNTLMEVPAPYWHASAWKVRYLLQLGQDDQSGGWSGDIVRLVIADLDRLSGQEG